ncbi:MAG: Oligopeptide transport ATP-binding protein OppD [uncultured Acidimicrobiales bacterium]|uniref:Oligopeptide transport ATP-binding protein OppD n=1 Tax=uncultured Acidimicrobiales bacterium TaxID=310071 RepID=A0A6J4HB69_9ACTN|nr:MAG: Oligopeptide transport ATP-binding protein OppD [uncultured Acidimicrobiales bacterium]
MRLRGRGGREQSAHGNGTSAAATGTAVDGGGAAEADTSLVAVTDLGVRFGDDVDALRGVSFKLQRGETLAIVGESGSGKSTLALCLSGLVQPPEARGSVRVDGIELLGASPEVLRSVRWAKVALALQGSPFNPVVSVGDQVAEPLRDRLGLGTAEARQRSTELAQEVMFDPNLLDRFPHQLSGGQRRRAMLAMVLALDPALVVLDEPTAGLDPATRHELVERIAALAEKRGFALVVISHDLPDAARLARRTMVLYAGEAMEVGDTSKVISEPAHPYTWALVGAYPVMSTTKDLRPIRGRPPDPRAVPPGCPYNTRCTQAEAVCIERPPLAVSRDRLVLCHFGGLKTLLAASRISKCFGQGRKAVTAVDDVSLTLREGESVGLVGPSGSGKSTLARILSGHLAADSGEVLLEGEPMPTKWRGEDRQRRRRVQLVMQDPTDALSPRLDVEALVREPLDLAKGDDDDPKQVVAEALESVGLPSTGTFLRAHSHELSGGQLQRVALARALVTKPKLLVADEPTAMLDASEQARLLVVLRERQVEMGLGLVLISHDLAVVRKVTDRMVVLDGGKVVEEGPSSTVSGTPQSPTGRLLVEASPAFPISIS